MPVPNFFNTSDIIAINPRWGNVLLINSPWFYKMVKSFHIFVICCFLGCSWQGFSNYESITKEEYVFNILFAMLRCIPEVKWHESQGQLRNASFSAPFSRCFMLSWPLSGGHSNTAHHNLLWRKCSNEIMLCELTTWSCVTDSLV